MGTFLITLFLGWAGVHKFIEGKMGIGLLYLFTFGLFGIGWLIDIIIVLTQINTSSKSVNSASNDMRLVFSNDFMIVGAQFECRKNKKKKRYSVIEKMRPGMTVNIEKYSYKGSPAYMIVDPKSNLDLGVLSQGAADWINRDYPNSKIVGTLSERHNDTFKVKINVYQ